MTNRCTTTQNMFSKAGNMFSSFAESFFVVANCKKKEKNRQTFSALISKLLGAGSILNRAKREMSVFVFSLANI